MKTGRSNSFEPIGFSEARRAHLAELEDRHFWFPARDAAIRRLVQALLSRKVGRLLELGCGSGRFLSHSDLERHARVGVEGHARFLDKAQGRSSDIEWIRADVTRLPLAQDSFDLSVALDVLEHVEPKAFLGEAFRVTRAGGILLLSVPAHPILYSAADEIAGHRCRYSVRSLCRELDESGWVPVRHTYYQRVLLPILAASRLWQRAGAPQLERHPPAWLNRLLGRINRLDARLLGAGRFPPGTSLVLWARKPDRAEPDHGATYQRHYYQRWRHTRIRPNRSVYTQRHLDELLAALKLSAGARVLEIGAGLGRFSTLLRERGIDVVATDVSPSLVQDLGRRFPALKRHVCDAAEVGSLGYAPFDAIVGFFVLHHLENLERVLRGAMSALRPGGQVAFCEPNAFHLPFYAQILLAREMTWRGDGGVRRMRRSVLERAFRGAGLGQIKIHRYGFVPPTIANHPLGRGVERRLEASRTLEPLRAFQIVSGRRSTS